MQETQVKSAFGQKSLTLERKLSISTRLLRDWEQSVLFTACLSLFPNKDFCSRWKLIKHFNCSIVNSGQAQELLCISDKTLPFPHSYCWMLNQLISIYWRVSTIHIKSRLGLLY